MPISDLPGRLPNTNEVPPIDTIELMQGLWLAVGKLVNGQEEINKRLDDIYNNAEDCRDGFQFQIDELKERTEHLEESTRWLRLTSTGCAAIINQYGIKIMLFILALLGLDFGLKNYFP